MDGTLIAAGPYPLDAVNQELAAFLARVDALVDGTGDLRAEEWRAMRRVLESIHPALLDAARHASVDSLLRAQLDAYARNLRVLEASLNQVRCVMLARRARVDAAQRHVTGLRGWVNAYRRTAP